MKRDEIVQAYKGKRLEKGETKPFNELFDQALEAYKETHDSANRFLPGSSVNWTREYGTQTFQDYGLVDDTDFFRLTQVTPKMAGVKPCPVSIKGPSAKDVDMYLISLRGLEVGEILAMRRTRVYFVDNVVCEKCYSNPKDQLLDDQAAFGFKYVYDIFQKGQHCSALHPPATAAELREKHEQKQILIKIQGWVEAKNRWGIV